MSIKLVGKIRRSKYPGQCVVNLARQDKFEVPKGQQQHVVGCASDATIGRLLWMITHVK